MALDVRQAIDDAFGQHSCSTMVAIGSVAAGFTAIGAFPLAALSLAGAAVAAKKCIDDPRPPLPGAGIPSVARCSTFYLISATLTNKRGERAINQMGRVTGPLIKVYAPYEAPFGPSGGWVRFNDSPNSGAFNSLYGSEDAPYTLTDLVVTREDGGPDNCAALPFQPYPPLPPTRPYPPIVRDPDGNPILPGNTYNITFAPTVNLPPVELPITFAPVILAPPVSFPLSFTVSIGSIEVGRVYLSIDGDVNIDLGSTRIDPEKTKDVDRILRRIEQCACAIPPKPPDFEVLPVPIVLPRDQGCKPSTVDLLVAKGSVDLPSALLLAQSADLAKRGCGGETPPQLPESVLFSATSSLLHHEFFSPEIPPSVYSVRLHVDSFGPAPIPVTSFPGSAQYKFGSIAWSGPSQSGSGDPVPVFDTSTYMVLPQAHLAGHVRILVKEGVSFTLFDTGERIL